MPFNCHRCGSLIKDSSLFCSYCGARSLKPSHSPPFWKIVLAVLLTLVMFGIAAVAALMAFCGVLVMGLNGRPNPNPQLWMIAVLGGAAVMFVLWVVGMVKLLR
jgi:hypothetical protein